MLGISTRKGVIPTVRAIGGTDQLPLELDLTKSKKEAIVPILVIVVLGAAIYFKRHDFYNMGGQNALTAMLLQYGPWILGAIGLFVLGKSVFALINKRLVRIDSGQVIVAGKSLISGENWSEPLSAYEGVRWRKHVKSQNSGSSSSSAPNIIYQIVELKHKNPKRNIPLFVGSASSRSDDIWSGSRERWEHFSKLFKLPAIDERDGKVRVRAAEDLDKSIRDLADEGQIDAGWDENARVPAGLEMSSVSNADGEAVDAIRVRLLALRAPIWVYGAFVAIGGVIFFYSLLGLMIMGMLVGIALGGGAILLFKAEKKTPRTVLVTRTHLEITNPMKGGEEASRKTIKHQDIEGVDIRRRSDIGILGSELLISTDKQEYITGGGLSEEGLEWLKGLIISAIAKA